MGLFAPFQCRGLRLRNRIVMAPMTRERAPGGVPTREMAEYYARRARGGTALLIGEGAPPNRDGNFGTDVPRMYGDDVVQPWSVVTRAVRESGGTMLAQLWHVGAFEPSLIGMQDSWPSPPVRLSPSGLAAPGRPHGRAMTDAEIEATIADYGAAARLACEAGFEGVEIHGAHGYLPDQFLWTGTNARTDRWGGSPAARARFAAEVVRACRAAVGPARVVSYRVSQWKQLDYAARIADTPASLGELLAPIVAAGVDLFHCSSRRWWEPAFEDDERGLAAWVKALTGVPTIAVGSVTLGLDLKSPGGRQWAEVVPAQIAQLEGALAAGHFDLVAVGRALLANPDWATRVQAGDAANLRPFSKEQLDTLT